MSRSIRLNDTQLALLTAAKARSNGNLLPAPDTLAAPAHRIRQAVDTLIKRGLAQELPTHDPAQAWRSDGDAYRAAIIADPGRAAVPEPAPAAQPAVSPPKAGTKAAAVVALLEREEGATLGQLVDATGWLPHTTRAALTGLRKKGNDVSKSRRDGVTVYTIAKAA